MGEGNWLKQISAALGFGGKPEVKTTDWLTKAGNKR